MAEALSAADIRRYARQIVLPGIGRAGQQTLSTSILTAWGDGPALQYAIELLEAAGPTVQSNSRPPIVAELDPSVSQLAGHWVATGLLVDARSACTACVNAFWHQQTPPAPEERAAVAMATGAAAANEILLELLEPGRPPLAMVFVPEPRRVMVARPSCECRR